MTRKITPHMGKALLQALRTDTFLSLEAIAAKAHEADPSFENSMAKVKQTAEYQLRQGRVERRDEDWALRLTKSGVDYMQGKWKRARPRKAKIVRTRTGKIEVRCVMDMDGSFLIGKGDNTIALTQEEAQAIAAFWSKLLP